MVTLEKGGSHIENCNFYFILRLELKHFGLLSTLQLELSRDQSVPITLEEQMQAPALPSNGGLINFKFK